MKTERFQFHWFCFWQFRHRQLLCRSGINREVVNGPNATTQFPVDLEFLHWYVNKLLEYPAFQAYPVKWIMGSPPVVPHPFCNSTLVCVFWALPQLGARTGGKKRLCSCREFPHEVISWHTLSPVADAPTTSMSLAPLWTNCPPVHAYAGQPTVNVSINPLPIA